MTNLLARIVLGFSLVAIGLFGPLPALAATNASPAAPAFTLQAGSGNLAPGSPLYLFANLYDNLKLLFAFSDDSKVMKRMDIADSKIVQMKNAMEENNLNYVEMAGTNYETQIAGVQQALSDGKIDSSTKAALKLRVQNQDNAFLYLFANSNDKISPILHDYWSQLQNVKTYL